MSGAVQRTGVPRVQEQHHTHREKVCMLRKFCVLRKQAVNEEMQQQLHTVSLMSDVREGEGCWEILYWGFDIKRKVRKAFPGTLDTKAQS